MSTKQVDFELTENGWVLLLPNFAVKYEMVFLLTQENAS